MMSLTIQCKCYRVFHSLSEFLAHSCVKDPRK